jgi:hypothetical protein
MQSARMAVIAGPSHRCKPKRSCRRVRPSFFLTVPAKVLTMDRQMLLDHLVEAEHRVAGDKNDIQEQYRIIAVLMRNGEDTVEAVAVLNQLIEAQEKHEADRDRLKAELADK